MRLKFMTSCAKNLPTPDLFLKKKSAVTQLDSADEPTWDHIFLDGEAQINRYAIVSPEALSTMSDHYPIFADVSIK